MLKYRRTVIRENLRRAFPDHTASDIEALAQANEAYFCDLLLETFRLFSWTQRDLSRHIQFHGWDIQNPALSSGKNIILAYGHLGNWEWVSAKYAIDSPFQFFGVYHPLSNPFFDELMYSMRRRWSMRLIRMRGALRKIRRLLKVDASDRKPFALALIADQSAPPTGSYWTRFLNQETAFFQGIEKMGRVYDLPVVYL